MVWNFVNVLYGVCVLKKELEKRSPIKWSEILWMCYTFVYRWSEGVYVLLYVYWKRSPIKWSEIIYILSNGLMLWMCCMYVYVYQKRIPNKLDVCIYIYITKPYQNVKTWVYEFIYIYHISIRISNIAIICKHSQLLWIQKRNIGRFQNVIPKTQLIYKCILCQLYVNIKHFDLRFPIVDLIV